MIKHLFSSRIFSITLGIILGINFFHFEFGALLGIILGWLIAEQQKLKLRLTNLEQQISDRNLTAPHNSNELAVASVTSIDSNQSITTINPEIIATPAKSLEAINPVSINNEEAIFTNKLTHIWLMLAGENPLARIGVLLLFLGVTFLFKYVASGIYIPLEVRFIGAAVVGIILIFVGWRLRYQRASYAMIMQGGGIGIWYLTVFIALRFGLVPVALAFPLLVAIPIFSSILALGQNASALALFSAAGGYLAPVLVNTGSGNHIQLFSYYALLNAGILGIAWFKAWRSLNILGFLFTFVISGVWGFFNYRPAYFFTTEPFLILFFLMYVAIAVLFALRQPPKLKGFVDGSLVFGLPVVAAGLQSGLVRHFEFGMAFSALALGGFYITLALWLWQRARLRLLCEAFLALGMVFLTLAIPLAVDGRWTAAAWALEGAAMIWIGTRQQRLLARISGILLQFSAGISFIISFIFSSSAGVLPIINAHFIGGILIAIAGIFAALQFDYYSSVLRSWERISKILLLIWGLWWWYGIGIDEIERFISPWSVRTVIMLFITGSALSGIMLRQPLASRLLAAPAALLLPGIWLAMNQEFYSDFWLEFTWWTAGLLAFIVQYLALRRLDRDFLNNYTRYFWHAATLWTLALWLALELHGVIVWLFNRADAWEIIVWGLIPISLAWWVMERGAQHAPWPVKIYQTAYLYLGCVILLLFAWGWVIYANIASTGDPFPLSYIPLFNPLDLAFMFVLLILMHWRGIMARTYPELLVIQSRPMLLIFSASVFCVINGMVARTVHHWAGVPYRFYELFNSSILQASLSLIWTTIALTVMVTATRRAWQQLWLAGALLLGVVVIKLFLIELANHGTLARIISFLGVGSLLLIIGYFAPPPREQSCTTN